MDRGSREESAKDERARYAVSVGEEDDIPASRECLYLIKQKPGVKSGAIESLNRRLEVLEKILLDSNGNQKSAEVFLRESGCDDYEHADGHDSYDASRLDYQSRPPRVSGIPPATISSQVSSSKKRKQQGNEDEILRRSWEIRSDDESLPPLPPAPLLEAIIDMHFETAHHWIPLLHVTGFKAKVKEPHKRPELIVLLHALVSAVIKHVKVEDFGIDAIETERQIRVSRNVVMLHAMDSLSVENLQALVILAFDHMGGGQISKAWSIIGSLTRTVEYLQLTVEPDETQRHALLPPLTLMENSKDWTESEERRRVFWTVFLLDRICSVTSGWKTSLTSDDVHRRLPCNGGAWAKEEEVTTPYFGIWDKSAAKIGKPISYIPAFHPAQNDQDHMTHPSPSVWSSSSDVDISKLGAFAYCIEATESLSQVTTFFLQQRVDFQDRQEVGSWLTRFKELDLRLVHWKMFLPQQWKDSNISRDVSVVNMDPNLTLAHITHNTSMVLLHQHIAYPPADWSEVVKLPSSCSAETCQLAAMETASIAKKYLRYMGGIVNCQFAFCAFVAAKVLLSHWRFYQTTLSSEFFSLIESLQDMSRRWRGNQELQNNSQTRDRHLDMAAKYAVQLQELHAKCLSDPSFGSNLLGTSGGTSDTNVGGLLPPLAIPHRRGTSSSEPPRPTTAELSATGNPVHRQTSTLYPPEIANSSSQSMNPDHSHPPYGIRAPVTSMSPSNDPHPYAPQRPVMDAINSGGINSPGLSGMRYGENFEDELTAMSNILLGQQFLEMDRVITLDGTDFDFVMRNWGAV